jgi:hypothetical protein
VLVERFVSPLDGITKRAGTAMKVTYAKGTSGITAVLPPISGLQGQGFSATFLADGKLDGRTWRALRNADHHRPDRRTASIAATTRSTSHCQRGGCTAGRWRRPWSGGPQGGVFARWEGTHDAAHDGVVSIFPPRHRRRRMRWTEARGHGKERRTNPIQGVINLEAVNRLR